jgi:hemoglobin
MEAEKLSEALLRRVIDEFYTRVRADPVLGPVFNTIIGDRWGPHIERIMSFWMMATRLRPGYRGRDFMPAHLRHDAIRAEQLPQWLALFRATCRDLCSPDNAATLILIAEQMAENMAISLTKRDSPARD